MTITLDIPTEWASGLQSLARQHGKDPAAFLLDGIYEQLRRDVLTEPEAVLLAQINAPLPSDAKAVRDGLLQTQAERELTDAERDAFADAMDTMEMANADRWQAIAVLADRRGLSLAEITRELKIPLL